MISSAAIRRIITFHIAFWLVGTQTGRALGRAITDIIPFRDTTLETRVVLVTDGGLIPSSFLYTRVIFFPQTKLVLLVLLSYVLQPRKITWNPMLLFSVLLLVSLLSESELTPT
jgi:hypothetical protein